MSATQKVNLQPAATTSTADNRKAIFTAKTKTTKLLSREEMKDFLFCSNLVRRKDDN